MKSGVTLLVLVVAISVMFVIISSASVIGTNSINQANYEEYKSMIKRVSDDINSYYLTNNELPINNEIVSVDSLGMDFSNNVKNNNDENDTFYIVNIDKLNNQTITNGRGTLQNKDVFLIAKNSNNLYYLKGFRFNDKINYSLRNEENTATSSADNIERYVKNGLVLHYDGINNTGTSHSTTTNIWKDLSGNGNDATLQSFDYNSSSGWLNNGLKFDGNNDFVSSIYNIPNSYNQYTMDIVYKPTVYRYSEITFNSIGFKWRVSGQNPYVNYWDISNNPNSTSFNFTPVLNSVHTFSINYNGSIMKLYINNQLLNLINKTITLRSNSTLVIGLGMEKVTGNVYSIRIYNRALTDSEVTQNYQVDVERFGI
jgi:hypothetical protein